MMRIEQIKIKNYKVFRDTTIDRIGDMAVFVGDNGTGKSIIFEVLAFLRDCVRIGVHEAVQVRGGIYAIQSRGQDGYIEISIMIRGLPIDISTITYYIMIGQQSGFPIVVREGLYSIDDEVDYLVFNRGNGFVVASADMGREMIALAESDLLGLSAIGSLDKYPTQHRVKKFIEGMYAFDRTTGNVRSCKKDTLLLLSDTNPPSLLCIDGPENHVYPGHHRELADFFRTLSVHHQFFVATHAPTFMDAVELSEAYFIEKRDDGFSDVRKVQDIPMVKQFFKEGESLGALWNQGLFEEGGS